MKRSVKYLLFTVIMLMGQGIKAQSFKADFLTVNYGAIKEWKNDTTWFYITNASKKGWYVLPTFYHQEFQVIAPKDKIFPGQKIRIGVSYYTESSGKFELDVPVYLSSELKPVPLKIKGKIISFHPDALVHCPTLDPKEPRVIEDFLIVDEKENFNDYEKVEEERLDTVRKEVVLTQVTEELDTFSVVEVEMEEVEVVDSVFEEDIHPTREEIVQDTNSLPTKKEEGETLNEEYVINNIVFLIDVSGSMKFDNKMKQLKSSLHSLVDVLRPQDRVAFVTYASRAKILYKPSSYANKQELHAYIDSLKADGSSYGKDGLDMAYALAKEFFIEGGNNSVILATDGKFNSKSFSENKLFRQAAFQAAKKIRLSTLGFGRDKEALKFLRKLTRFGRGRYVKVQKGDAGKYLIVDMVKSLSKKSEK